MIIFSAIYQIVIHSFHFLRKLFAIILLKYILGWRIRNFDDIKDYKKGKHVVIYAQTSVIDSIFGLLISMIYDISFVSTGKIELKTTPIIGRLMKYLDVIYIDRKKIDNSTNYISNELSQRKDFCFTISPEGHIKKAKDINSGFYQIAKNTEADIIMIRFDYENHIISKEEIANDAIVAVSDYEPIKKLVETAFSKEKPYRPEYCHLINPGKVGKTSIISYKNSILIYVPLVIVLLIMMNVLSKYIFFL